MYITGDIHISGLKFWKCGSRHIYAIDMKKVITVSSDSSSDESDFVPLTKRRDSIDQIANDVKTIKGDIASLFEISRMTKVPLGVKKMMIDTFRCTICQGTPMMPPVIFSKCCKNLIGCQQCVDQWYSGSEGMHAPFMSSLSCREGI